MFKYRKPFGFDNDFTRIVNSVPTILYFIPYKIDINQIEIYTFKLAV